MLEKEKLTMQLYQPSNKASRGLLSCPIVSTNFTPPLRAIFSEKPRRVVARVEHCLSKARVENNFII